MAEVTAKLGKVIEYEHENGTKTPAMMVGINEDGTVNLRVFLDGHGDKYIANYEL